MYRAITIDVSLYCRPKGDIRTQMAKLERIVRKKNGRRVICGADLNSRSVLWNGKQTDRRGFIVEETLEVLDMEVLNKKNKNYITTFKDTRGRGSNIDVIFITENLRKEMGNWQLDQELISDHRMLITEWKREVIVGSGTNNDNMKRVGGYNLRKMKKQMFEKLIKELGKRLVDSRDKKLDEMVENLQKGIGQVCDMSIPRIKVGEKQVGWWTKEIAGRRRNMRRKQKRWLKTRDESSRTQFVAARTRYFAGIRDEKRKWWTKVLEDEGEKEPWSKAYKIIMEKNKRETKIISLRNDDGSLTENLEETVELMLNKLIPKDSMENDSTRQMELRERINEESKGIRKSRVEIEKRCEKAMEAVVGWMEENKLELSKEKTVIMLLKRNMDDERQAGVIVRRETMRNVRTVKYLGVKIDRGMRYESHAKYLAEKTTRIHNKIKRVTKANGGMSRSQKMIIYEGVMEPIMVYACEL
ncbi:hypothetical protein M0802_015458 [Mischocyttarus mexicanus]|nr:hypothetical protein M0802_015458 [Mischocyttarus mexicanus]